MTLVLLQVSSTRLGWLIVLDRLQEGVDRVSQVRAVRDRLSGVEGQQLLVVGVHGRRCRGWHLNGRIVRLRHQQIVIAAQFLRQRGPELLALLRHDLSRVEIHVIVILPGAAVVAAARGDDRGPFEEQRGIPLRTVNLFIDNKDAHNPW